ncbi:tetratricopeptide repeat protein [Bradyrhizobium sp. dw_411]|uniref:tetratricopeptide repeat protein n=1 Tax=Bradyrhizobium sp. dw_411 TaxID=2720082 RepID=UPI00201B9FC2|nr:tetratricopeptide repeat protein [Bradyrhizobium sp. dw_411]
MNRRNRRAAAPPPKANAKANAKASSNGPPASASAACKTGFGHLRAGRYLDAQICCQQALAAAPDHADSLHLMGLLSRQAENHDLAVEWIARAIQQDPKAEYLSSLGGILRQQERFEEALKAYDKAVQLKPKDTSLWINLGNVLSDLARLDDALLAFQHVLKLDLRHWDAAYRCGFILEKLGRYAEALTYFTLSDALKPNQAPVVQMRALVLQKMKRFEQALPESLRAYELDPGRADTCNNIGAIMQSFRRDEEALVWFDKALALQPDYVPALTNKANSLQQFHRFDEAAAIYRQIKTINPGHALADWDLALIDMRAGNFEAGWAGREARWKAHKVGYPKFPQPMWLGAEDIAGKTILICSDEGLGDSIQFARYVPMLAARGARVILVVDDAAYPLLSALPGVSESFRTSDKVFPAFDMHCPTSSLPLAFATRLDTIPADIPYLPAPAPSRVQAWEDRLGPHSKLRVGLVWSGNPLHNNDHNRSVPFQIFSRLFDADATFVSLQKDARPDDKAALCECPGIIDLTSELTDFNETAALIACLDLVITVDTSVAHLAGALGCPTWILLPYTPDYRWLLDRDDSPWYPTVRLFRQSAARDYAEVLDRVRTELAALCAERNPDAQISRRQAPDPGADDADSLHRTGVQLLQAGQYDQAVEWIARAIRQDPRPEYLSSLGTTLQRQGRFEEALKTLDKAVQLKPEDTSLWIDLGTVLSDLARLDEALLAFQHVLKLNMRHWDAAYRCGFILDKLGRHTEALTYFTLSDMLKPNHAPIVQMRAIALQKLKRFEQALAESLRAYELDPDRADTCNNIGAILHALHRDEEALVWFDKALAFKPDYMTVLCNKASSLQQVHRFEEAAATYRYMKTIDPGYTLADWDLALIDMRAGNFEAGWAGREARWTAHQVNYPRFPQPMWLGAEDIAGKTILICSDEGIGDSIQFARYVPMLAARGARVILVVVDAVYSLLSDLPGVSECFRKSDKEFPAFDMHCATSSLPLAFVTRLDTIPADIPYLPAPAPSRVQAWEDRLGPRSKLRVGLVWSGNPIHSNDHNRSVPFQTFSRLFDVHATFVSLQKDARPDDKTALREYADIIDLTAGLTDFNETAALIACLDLVITVDTSVAHLAGALGCPTWILLPYTPDYRWLLDRDDSPWYPTVRLFRQSAARDYAEVLDRVSAELAALCAERNPDAPTSRRQAPDLGADDADSLHRTGVQFLQAGQYDQAVESITRAIRQDPKPDYLASLGATLHRQGRHEDALKAYDKAIQLKPEDAGLWHRLGNILLELQRLDHALLSFAHVLKLDPRHQDAAYKSGVLLQHIGRFDESIAHLDLCDALLPNHAPTLQARARTLFSLKRLEEALAENRRAHTLDPGNADTCNNIGACLQSLGREEEALSWFDSALDRLPNTTEILNNKGLMLSQLQRFDEAFALHDQIRALQLNDATTDWNLALLQMLTGNFEAGWAGRESRWRKSDPPPYPKFSQPMWLGQEPIEGKTILVHVDEGAGDTIQFVRYVPMLAERGARIVLVVERHLHALMSGLQGVEQCLSFPNDPLPAFDMHCPIGSLPLVFGTRLDSIPSATSYLPPPAEGRVQFWEARLVREARLLRKALGPHDRPRVGLVWSGNPSHRNDVNRSTSLRLMSRILDVDATFVSLQKDPKPEDKAFLAQSGIIDLTAELTDFSETAALIACLDLVITVDTSVAHLAGALGCPTWILLPYTPDYRWLLDRDDSPWYPTVRLFRQSAARDYAEVLDRVRTELAALCAETLSGLLKP